MMHLILRRRGARPALLLGALALLAPATAARAHPHIFISTTLALEIDEEGQLTGIDVTWAYDEMYSMLLLDELSLDPDFDGILTDAELEELDGYDLNWMEGFAGDLYVTAPDGQDLALGPPEGLGVTFDDGVYASRHRRRPEALPEADGLVVKAYDPTFYTAYDLQGGVSLSGPGASACELNVTPPEVDDAYEELAAELAELPPDATGYPEVGETFADTIRIRCGGSE
ncbi:hypothetical protein PSM7751_00330 [Pseudooceanicola marinus]|uniref:Polyphosphate kinase n=1 Tax=Pseudooceanicola marinus TaxID=396013 RepID=A0A1X6Y8P5_9RHOB|nr:DUF1007 family protein [Pseudooceanicola marinus]SLN14052.1 hypothetical protein PSM7751_00330 [Pseudooceanicola marinus]